MNTYLGSSEFLGPEDVDGDLIAAAQVTYLEGYLFDRPESQEAYWKASRIAHDAGRRVSLTLSDTFCVERHKEAWRSLVTDQVDVLFANEGEAMALYDVSTLDEVIRHAQADVEIAAITSGPKGSLVVHADEVIEVAAHPVPKVVDTTGAGDLYAAGVLHGLATGRDLATCGRLGGAAAAEVISHLGARPQTDLAALTRDAGI
jgi:sugar/nucleoside kinase (ribokinase family)